MAVVSEVSAVNSTATPLGASGVFTGAWIPLQSAGSITVTAFANVASATDGLSIQQSTDGANADVTDVYNVGAGANVNVLVPVKAAFGRVVYTNGAGAQSAFRLQTIIRPQMPVASAVRPADGAAIQNDFPVSLSLQENYNGTTRDLVRSVINATNSTGTGITAAGILAQLDDTSPTTITENQFGNLRMAPNRALMVAPYSSTAEYWQYAAAASGIVNTTTAVTIKAAAGASVRNYITGLSIQTATLGAATELAIRDGAGGTVIWRTQLQTTALPLTNIEFPTPLRGTANTLLEVVTLTAVTGGVYVNVQGFIAP